MDGHSLSRSGCEPPSPAEIWIKKWLQTHNRMKKRSQIRLMAASAAAVTQCLIWISFFKSDVTFGGGGENQKVSSRREGGVKNLKIEVDITLCIAPQTMHFGVCDNAKLFPRFSTLFLHKKIVGELKKLNTVLLYSRHRN